MAGRPLGTADYKTWSINPHDPTCRATCAHISILVKKNPNMTLSELARLLSKHKRRPLEECTKVLEGMLSRGHLGYFDDKFKFHRWTPRSEEEESVNK